VGALHRVREKYKVPMEGSSKSCKSPSAGSAGPRSTESKIPSRLSRDLELRIKQMATNWRYSDEDLADALQRAAANPVGWLALVEHDDAQRLWEGPFSQEQ
jgi:hypothetical protein